MQTAQRILVVLGVLIGFWVLTSVAGAFFDPAHPEFWSASLMWSMLSSLLVAPALVMLYDASDPSSKQTRSGPSQQVDSTSARTSSTPPQPFVQETGAAYPVSEESEADPEAENEGRPDWVEAHTV
jgi:hypothetical protein